MNTALLRLGASGISIGTLFVLSLFLIGVMMCSVTFLFSPTGHHFFAAGCDQVSFMMSYITLNRGQGLLVIFMTLLVMAMFGGGWPLGNIMKERALGSKEKLLLVRAVVDLVLLSFRQGIIRNLLYN